MRFLHASTGARGWRKLRGGVDMEVVSAAAVLAAAVVIGLATAGDYGITIDEFNTDDYGPKALAWYTSGFKDRSQFETVEFSLWYYGPWFQILTAFAQSLDLAEHLTVRHALTFLVGLFGIAVLLPIGRLAVGRWGGLTAIALCLLTGYLYGSLFFTPIDVPFLAAMSWATLAILVMTRNVVPSWRATICTGLLTGLAIGTRTGGIITHAYLLAALTLCALDIFAAEGRLPARYLRQLVERFAVVVILAWLTAILIWPWLELGNPLRQFATALAHFATIAMQFEFSHWGERISTDALPRSYIPGQLLARLPEAFLLLLAFACIKAIAAGVRFARDFAVAAPPVRRTVLWAALAGAARRRALIVVVIAVLLPLGFLIVQRATLYDGIRHVLFVIPMLGVLGGAGMRALLPLLRRVPVLAALAAGGYLGAALLSFAALHPLEYVAFNSLAGGTRGAYDAFETDYWGVAATVALRRLEERLDYAQALHNTETVPSIMICLPWREWMVAPMLRRPWKIETEANRADYVIETQRWRCAEDKPLVLIDEVKRSGMSFAWIYARRPDAR